MSEHSSTDSTAGSCGAFGRIVCGGGGPRAGGSCHLRRCMKSWAWSTCFHSFLLLLLALVRRPLRESCMPEIGTYSLSGGRRSARERASSDPTGTAQPLCLSASGTEGRRYDSTMNLRKRKTHSVSLHYWGWTARPFPLRFAVAGEVFVLTSLFIERDYRNVENTPNTQGRIPIRRLPGTWLRLMREGEAYKRTRL